MPAPTSPVVSVPFQAINKARYDVLIVGGGLSGLTAALFLQKLGYKVIIIEKSNRAGGLCGTYITEGYEFVIACNDFGSGFAKIIKELGVPVAFEKKKTRFIFDHGIYHIPPTPSTLFNTLKYLPDIRRFVSALKKKNELFLGDLIEKSCKDQRFRDIINSIAYPLGMNPSEVPFSALKEELSKEYNYGYNQPTIPVGGTRILVDKMLDTFIKSGGTLKLETECFKIEQRGQIKKVITQTEVLHTKQVISSQGRWDQYKSLKAGMHLSMFNLAVKPSLSYPKGIHTIVYTPSNVNTWLTELTQGKEVKEFGFHIFKSDLLTISSGYYPLNVYFYFPKGVMEPTIQQIKQAEAFIFQRIEKILPGFLSSILFKKFVSPAEFIALHGLTSQTNKFVLPHGFKKPEIYDHEKDIYYVGNSVYPPGEHAGGAVLSGKKAAEIVHVRLSQDTSPGISEEKPTGEKERRREFSV